MIPDARLRSIPVVPQQSGQRIRAIALIAAGALAGAAVVAALALLVGMRQDLASLDRTAATQQALVEQQLDAIRQQIDLIRESLGLQRSTRSDVGAATTLTDRIDARMQQLVRLIRQMRDDLDEMNRRTGGAAGSRSP